MMGRRGVFFFVLLALGIAYSGFAQQDSNFDLDISVGPAIPLGDFGEKDADNDDAGFAKTGFELAVFGNWTLQSPFGIAAGWVVDGNYPDLDAVLDEFSSIDPTLNWEAEAEAFLTNALLVGPSFSQTSGNTYLGLTLSAGVAFVRFPELTVTASDGSGNEAEVVQERALAASLAARARAKVGFWVDSSTAITLGATYMYTNPTADDVELSLSENGTVTATDSSDIEQEIQILTIPIGVVISL
jgi:hypothetical protein